MTSKFLLKSVNRWWLWALVAIAALLLADALLNLLAESFWFQEVNYLEVFWIRLRSQLLLGLIPIFLTLLCTWGNLSIADRVTPMPRPEDPTARARSMSLQGLLTLSIILSVLVGIQLLYQGQLASDFWQDSATLYDTQPPPPLWPRVQSFRTIVDVLIAQPWQIIALVVSTVAFLFSPKALGRLAAVFMSLGFGLILAEQWPMVLLSINPASFNQQDPIFGRDISFYLFRLPVWHLVEFWLIGTLFFTLASVCLVYLLGHDNLNQGRFYGFSAGQQQHLYTLAGALFMVTSLSHWLGRYEILYNQEGVVYGAGFTHVNVLLPANVVLSAVALALGLVFLARGLLWSHRLYNPIARVERRNPMVENPPSPAVRKRKSTSLLARGILLYLVLTLLGVIIVPMVVQRLVVQPNELRRERPFIQNSIRLTRSAFDLESIDSEPFDPSGDLSVEDLQNNDLTLENIRLWDTRPFLDSNRQLQQIRLYYQFKDADFDRYTLFNPDRSSDRRQVLVSARELDYEGVPEIARTWVNEHLVYSHGYGFTMSPVNTADQDGLPAYFIRGIDHVPSSEAVRNSIPVGEPRIYFGELTDTYIMTNTRVLELDYPSGDENVVTVYQGRAGINIGGFSKRLLFARHLLDWRMMFSEDFLPQSRLLFRRNIAERVQSIAPFLRFDTDPYLVVTNIDDASKTWGTGPHHGSMLEQVRTPEELAALNPDLDLANYDSQDDGGNYLYWVIDAYTVSDNYPYSDPGENDFNYIRNSVKVVVDAYNGAVAFYVVDPDDPIIQTWERLIPGMFMPLTEMPDTLRAHIRYPQDLFRVQADSLMTYHMTDPQVFYNREDQWRAPNEIYDSEAQQVPPYYLIMRLPEEDTEEFVLLRLFTPAQRNNLIAWLAARSDGERYGLRLLYRFPKQELVFGPEQIEARINQDPEISQRISLWNTQGSRAQQGNLLVIPIERSLIYVEPLYLVAEQNQLPALTRVIMVYKNRIAMAENLSDALSAIFLEEPETAPPILRDLGETPGDTAVPGLSDLTAPQGSPDGPTDAGDLDELPALAE
jgi:uncharacterized membrane protein (UPF0182 family)